MNRPSCSSSPIAAMPPHRLSLDTDMCSYAETIRSLKTASSATMHEDWSPEASRSASPSKGKATCTIMRKAKSTTLKSRLRAIRTRLLDLHTLEVPKEYHQDYEDLVELQRAEFYDVEVRNMAWSLILHEMHQKRVEGIIRALVELPIHECQQFFLHLHHSKTARWATYPGTQAPRTSCSLCKRWEERVARENTTMSFNYMFIAVLSDRRTSLDRSQVLSVLTMHTRCRPVALLFKTVDQLRRPDMYPHEVPSLGHFFVYLQAGYQDPLSLGALPEFPYEWPLEAAAIFFSRSDTSLVCEVVGRILTGLRCDLSRRGPRREDVDLLRREAPFLDLSHPLPNRIQHPASPFLWFAIHLSHKSRTASQQLVEGGLLGAIERLYDQEPPGSYQKEMQGAMTSHSRQIMLQLCYLLLTAVSRHCDLRDCVLKEELSAEVREESRQLSEHYFGCVWMD